MSAQAAPAPLFPLFADLRGRRVLVVGGGQVARRKVEALLEAGADVVVGAPELDDVLSGWAQASRLTHVAGTFDARWLDEAWLAIAATDDADVNRAVAEAGEARRIWVNVVDDATLARVQIPARIERGPLQIAISSAGAAPMLARWVREQLETQFDESLGTLAELLARHRDRIRKRWPDMGARRQAFSRLLAGPIMGLLRQRDQDAAEAVLERALGEDALRPVQTGDGAANQASGSVNATATATSGFVSLVGAGPGDAGLLTLRGLRVLNEADVILHDRLVSHEVLQLARRDAERIEVGKQAGNHHATQDQIHALMLAHALAGRRVVRLKGGDPFVFGRGGEELEILRAHGIAYEVVPGITAAVACAAYAGIPLTHRDHAQSVRLVTAHCKTSLDTLDWPALAQERQTVAVYMGVAMLETVQQQLIAHGRSPSTPFALIENGSRPQQRVVTGPLSELSRRANAHAVQSPSLLVIGEVAALADSLHWFGAAPLTAVATASMAQAA